MINEERHIFLYNLGLIALETMLLLIQAPLHVHEE